MKKLLLSLFLLSLFSFGAYAQKTYKKFSLTGFDVEVILAESFSYKCENKHMVQEEELEGGVLSLKFYISSIDAKKNKLTIYTPSLDAMTLNQCDLTIANGAISNLNIDATNHSTISIQNMVADTWNIDIKSSSNLHIDGQAKSLTCKVNSASEINSAKLTADKFLLDIASASKAQMELDVKTFDLVAKYAVDLQFTGKTDFFKCNANMAVRMNASRLEAEKAEVQSLRGSALTVNAKNMKENPEVINVFMLKNGGK